MFLFQFVKFQDSSRYKIYRTIIREYKSVSIGADKI